MITNQKAVLKNYIYFFKMDKLTIDTFKVLGLIFLIVFGTFLFLICCWKIISMCAEAAPVVAFYPYLEASDSYSTIESGGLFNSIPTVHHIRNKSDNNVLAYHPIPVELSLTDSIQSILSSQVSTSSKSLETRTSPQQTRMKKVHWQDESVETLNIININEP